MRLNRFFGNFDFDKEAVYSSDRDLINQLKNVLRLKAGNEIILCDGKNNEAYCVIESLSANEVVFKVLKTEKNNKEFKQEIILYSSILKRENFELVVQKAVELGVKRIVPVITAKTVKLGLKRDRLEKIIKESAEQSGRGILPVLSDSMGFEEAIKQAEANDLNLFCDLGGKSFEDLGLNKKTLRQAQDKIGVFIGPEGGWADSELKVASSKLKVIGLSPFVLRAETAAIATLAQLTQLLSQ